MNPGPPPWSRSAPPEPETTPDGRRIRRDPRFGAFVEDEPGKWCMYISPKEERARVERLFAEPRRRQGRVAMDWSVWQA